MDHETVGPFELESSRLGALPIVEHFLGRMRLEARLERCLPAGDARVSLAATTAIEVLWVSVDASGDVALGEGRFELGIVEADREIHESHDQVGGVVRWERENRVRARSRRSCRGDHSCAS